MDREECRKVAVWLCNHSLKNTSYFVSEVYHDLCEYNQDNVFTEKMLSVFRELTHNKNISEQQAKELLDTEIAKARQQISFWQENPTDTNARFFRLKYKQIEWED